jgi:putative phage-type endonuclease
MSNEPTRAGWLEDRSTGIGGSDAAAVCGMSSWKITRLDIYIDKTGYLDGVPHWSGRDTETFDMRRGKLLEPVVLQMYTDDTGRVVRTPEDPYVSREHPFVRANLDGITLDGTIGIEAKTSRSRRGWGEPWTAEIPVDYLFQVQHCMIAAGLDVFHVPVLFGDFEFAIYEVEADREFQDLMLEHEARFWAMVEARTPPDLVNDADVSKRWPVSRPIGRPATKSDLEVGGHLLAVRDYFKKLEAVKKSLEAELKRSMEDVEALVCGDETVCTWKTAKGTVRFDAKKFRAAHPKLYEEYSYSSASGRRFLFKEKARCLEIMRPLLHEDLLPKRNLIGGGK